MDKKLIRQTAKTRHEKVAMVEMIVDHYSQFIVDVISSGELENVRVPMFGTFKVNMKKIRRMVEIEPLPKTKLVRREGSKPVPKSYKVGK